MIRCIFCVMCLTCLFLQDALSQNPVKVELGRLQGKYKQVSVKAGDKQLPEELVAQLRLVIKDDNYDSPSILKGPPIKLKFTIDPNKNPKQIDLVGPDKNTIRCIYELTGNRLRIARPSTDLGERPKDFDNAQYIEVWERIKD